MIAHHVHQGDGLGGIGHDHHLNRHRRKGEGDIPSKMRICFMKTVRKKFKQKLRAGMKGRWEKSKEETRTITVVT